MSQPTYLPFTRPDIDEATISAVGEVLRSGWLASGPKVVELERLLGVHCGGRTVRALTSATAGLEIALHMIGIRSGDEVITPAMSFAATANVIDRVGARPVFVDVDLDTRNIDLAAVERAITPRTRALMPVHFAGHPFDSDELYAIARRHGLRVIEDAAHAIGTRYRGRHIGAFGDIVVFSFHPNKNMTTTEGGAVVADDPREIRLLELHRFHGLVRHPDGNADVLFAGGKCNLTDVAAQIGIGQLARLEAFNARRRDIAARYFQLLQPQPALRLPARGTDDHSWHLFPPLLPLAQLRIDRGGFIRLLHERGIGIGVHYPAMHLFTHYRRLGYQDGAFPNAERIGRETVSLPMFPGMRDADVDRVCSAIHEIFRDQQA